MPCRGQCTAHGHAARSSSWHAFHLDMGCGWPAHYRRYQAAFSRSGSIGCCWYLPRAALVGRPKGWCQARLQVPGPAPCIVCGSSCCGCCWYLPCAALPLLAGPRAGAGRGCRYQAQPPVVCWSSCIGCCWYLPCPAPVGRPKGWRWARPQVPGPASCCMLEQLHWMLLVPALPCPGPCQWSRVPGTRCSTWCGRERCCWCAGTRQQAWPCMHSATGITRCTLDVLAAQGCTMQEQQPHRCQCMDCCRRKAACATDRQPSGHAVMQCWADVGLALRNCAESAGPAGGNAIAAGAAGCCAKGQPLGWVRGRT